MCRRIACSSKIEATVSQHKPATWLRTACFTVKPHSSALFPVLKWSRKKWHKVYGVMILQLYVTELCSFQEKCTGRNYMTKAIAWMLQLTWFLRSGEVRESQGKSRWSGEVREFKSTMVQKLTKMQKKTELLHAHCIQQFKIFSAHFAHRLFILLLFHLFCRPCF